MISKTKKIGNKNHSSSNKKNDKIAENASVKKHLKNFPFKANMRQNDNL